MGAGKKKAHESFSVAPSVTEAPVMPEGLAPLTEVDLDAIAAPSGDAAIALDAYNDALAMATPAWVARTISDSSSSLLNSFAFRFSAR